MIVYFADRQLNILGQASTGLPQGLRITDDKKVEEIETGINTFECDIHFNKETRAKVESYAAEGNYILRNHNGENELYTIIENEVDTKNQTVYIYAEDVGLDLINEVVGAYEATGSFTINHYINKYASDAGFVIGKNEAKGLTRKLSWDGESTVTERLASIATQFDNCEISYRYEIDRLSVVKRYIDIYKERGKDVGVTLFLNRDIDSIITTKSIANLATALQCTGGTPENEEKPITLKGYKYDDGDFYVDGQVLKSRKALKRWNRYLWKTDEAQQAGGHITKLYSYDTTNQATLCKHAVTELKKICDTEVNYEIDIKKLPDNVKIGDRVNIVDDAGEMYISTRILKLETSVSDQEYKATLGEHIIKTSGISQKVTQLASQFASTAQSASRALVISNTAKSTSESAQTQANAALESAASVQGVATEANEKANTALQSATEAKATANNAQAAVGEVSESVKGLETTVSNAQQAANNAQAAATAAQQKADEAKQSSLTAIADAAIAKATAETTDEKANLAISKAEEAKSTANTAKSEAEAAKTVADAAKLDAEKAQKDVDDLAEQLDTIIQTMTASYARETELTETTAELQAQITKNAAEISETMSKVVVIDATANNAKELAEGAQTTANTAKQQAEQAIADAQAAQNSADTAAQAAANAQSEADKAKSAAANAQSVADKAETDLAAAQADLATVASRVDATEEEIAAAQQAVTTAQAAANKANEDVAIAQQAAATAQSTANTAKTNAENAQSTANEAASKANLAQQVANEAKGNATAAQQVADEAAEIATEAQNTANAAVTNATTAQNIANEAQQTATSAQELANTANEKAVQSQTNLATAQQNLAAVTSRVGATEAEIQAAQQAVETAQAAANKAKQDAATAQSTADTAKTNAATAQAKANEAKGVADQAVADAKKAQDAVDEAQAAVDSLSVRVTTAETNITKNADEIALRAKKTEVEQTLGGYYTKTETDAAISVKSNEILSTVSAVENTANDAAANMSAAESTIQQLADSISSLVTDSNGSSLMSQTASGGWTFSTATIQGTVEQTAESLKDLVDSVGDIDTAVGILQSAVNDLGVIAEYVKIGTYTYTDSEGVEQVEPSIDFGETDTGFRLKITNTRIAFTDGANTLVYIDSKNKSLTTQKVAAQVIQIGGSWEWKKRANGNLGLVWKGAE